MKIWLPVIRGESGTDVFTRRLSEALQHRGISAEVSWFPSRYQFFPLLLQRVPPPTGTTLVHANSWNAFAFKRRSIPLVVTEHLNVLDPAYRPYKSVAQILYHQFFVKRFTAASFREASAVTAVSRFVAARLAKTANLKTVNSIPNWIDTKVFSPRAEPEREDGRPFRLLFVGNLSRRKGADLLAPIMRELGPGFELHYTSSGQRRGVRIPEESNMKNIGFMVQDHELVDAYRKCRALLFPSRFEGFGLVALEAMACGKPVIATRTSSLPEVVEDGVTGILCPPNDIEEFSAACRKLADDPKTLQRYGLAARRRAEDQFSEDFIIPQYIALYETIGSIR